MERTNQTQILCTTSLEIFHVNACCTDLLQILTFLGCLGSAVETANSPNGKVEDNLHVRVKEGIGAILIVLKWQDDTLYSADTTDMSSK
jgi:hypothetical protein